MASPKKGLLFGEKSAMNSPFIDRKTPSHYWRNTMRTTLFRFCFIALLGLCYSGAWAVANPLITSANTYDMDSNGHIDKIDIYFDSLVDIIDEDSMGGFEAINVGKYKVVPGDYTAMGVTSLSLSLEEGMIFDTGAIIDVEYMPGSPAGNIFNGSLLELSGSSVQSVDAAAPMLVEAITYDEAAGHVVLRFSEPVEVVSEGGNILGVSDFIYNDISGDNVISISSMASDSDATDGAVVVTMNTAIASSDLNVDEFQVTGGNLQDYNMNPIDPSPYVTLMSGNLQGGAVEVDIADVAGGIYDSMDPQYLMTLEFFETSGSLKEVESIALGVGGIDAMVDFSDFTLESTNGDVFTASTNGTSMTQFNLVP
ncbi:MAG: hypothetical protein HQL32_16000, partial [Planctomycetes bacterium]|nr:hypothetical protein [Planctomycetota bacterium]